MGKAWNITLSIPLNDNIISLGKEKNKGVQQREENQLSHKNVQMLTRICI